MSIEVDKISSLEELQSHRESWNQLARSTPMAQFFQSYDWFATYWKHFGEDQRMEVLLVTEDAQLVGIVPLVIRTERRRIGNVRILTYPLDDWGSFFGPVTSKPSLTISAAIDFIIEQRKSWDVLSWRWLAPNHSASEEITARMDAAGLKAFPSIRSTTCLIDLPATWDEYLASRTGKFRNNLRRWQRRINEIGTLRYEKYRPEADESCETDPRWDLYDACENLAARSWQGDSQTGTTLSHQSIRPFLRDVHQAAAAIGAADVNLLYLNDSPVAFEYGYWWQGYKYSLRFGYDREISQAGIGNLMWLETIQASIAAADHTFDMGPGSLEYKQYYMTRTSDCRTLDHYRTLAPKAQAIALKHVFKSWWPNASPVS